MRGFRSGVAVLVAGGLLVACMPQAQEEEVSGRALYVDLCASCHGDSGRGDGPAAAGLSAPIPDLTVLARNNRGEFPLVAVMSHIDGYTRTDEGDPMPEFGPLLDGQLVPVDTGDGVLTPTPAPLFALAEYLQTLQR